MVVVAAALHKFGHLLETPLRSFVVVTTCSFSVQTHEVCHDLAVDFMAIYLHLLDEELDQGRRVRRHALAPLGGGLGQVQRVNDTRVHTLRDSYA